MVLGREIERREEGQRKTDKVKKRGRWKGVKKVETKER